MKRYRFMVVGVAVAVVCTQALAGEALPARLNPLRPHVAKTIKELASKSASLSGVTFSDPYAPPVGLGKVKGGQFPMPEREEPVTPQGGFSITAGRESPDAPFTGGIKLRY